jgi:hypothetical protein
MVYTTYLWRDHFSPCTALGAERHKEALPKLQATLSGSGDGGRKPENETGWSL